MVIGQDLSKSLVKVVWCVFMHVFWSIVYDKLYSLSRMEIEAVQSLYVCASFFLFTSLALSVHELLSLAFLLHMAQQSQPQFNLRSTTDLRWLLGFVDLNSNCLLEHPLDWWSPYIQLAVAGLSPFTLPPHSCIPLDPQCMYGWSFCKLCWSS